MISKENEVVSFYKQGLQFLNSGQTIEAELSFNKATKIKENFAPAYEGLARVYLQRGQLHKAENFAKQSLEFNKSWLPARIALAKIYLAEGANDLSRDELHLALKQMLHLNLPNLKSEVYALLSQNDLQQNSYLQAEINGKRALEFKADNAQAQEILDEIQDILARLRGRGQLIQELAAKAVITRADLAILLFTEFREYAFFKEDSTKRNQIPISAIDVGKGHPAFDSVQWNLRHDLLPILPDNTFRPNDKVDRAEMALFLKHILDVVVTDSAYRHCFARGARFYSDVQPYYPYFKALQIVSSLRLMDSKDKYFRPHNTISGLQAVQSIDRLKEIIIDLRTSK